jgi:hypothetical protein
MPYTQRANCFQCEQLNVFIRLSHEVCQCVAHLILDVILWNKTQYFIFSWQRISLRFLANNQLDALLHVFICFIPLHVSSITVLIIRRSNCINTSSGMISLRKWLLGMLVRKELSSLLTGIQSSHLHRLIIPDDVLIQFDLLIMSTMMLETCRQMKEIKTRKSASSWLLARICNNKTIKTPCSRPSWM